MKGILVVMGSFAFEIKLEREKTETCYNNSFLFNNLEEEEKKNKTL